jgi:hypothetical protein
MGSFIGKVTDAVGLTDISGTEKRAKQAAESQREAAQLGAEVSAFRPVGMTTRFGGSNFGITDVGGVPRVTSAGYTVSPELVAIQDQLMALTGGTLDTARQAQMAGAPIGQAAQSLFNIGGQYLATSPAQARQQYIDEQMALLDPIRRREEERLGASVFGRGRAGLQVGDMGQPELFALASARRAQEAQLAAQADQAAQQRIGFGSGLFSTGAGMLGQQYALPTAALGPLSGILGTVGSIEEMGQDPFRLGLSVGGAAQTGADTGSRILSSGLSNAASTLQQGLQAASDQRTAMTQKLAGAAMSGFGGGMFGGGMGAASGFGMGSLGYGMGYGINPLGQQAQMLANQW